MFETTDLALSAYLKMKGLKLSGLKRGKVMTFQFGNDERAEELALEYANSDFAKFESELRSLKKLVHSKRG